MVLESKCRYKFLKQVAVKLSQQTALFDNTMYVWSPSIFELWTGFFSKIIDILAIISSILKFFEIFLFVIFGKNWFKVKKFSL